MSKNTKITLRKHLLSSFLVVVGILVAKSSYNEYLKVSNIPTDVGINYNSDFVPGYTWIFIAIFVWFWIFVAIIYIYFIYKER